MRFKQRKELADKYRKWVKQTIDNNQTMILDCAESLLAWLDVNGYLNEVVHCEHCMFNHWHTTPNGEKYHICNLNKLSFSEHADFFCKYGERRESVRLDNES